MAVLLVMGGAAGTGILRRFVSLAGGPAASVVVIATASECPDELEAWYTSVFAELGADVPEKRLITPAGLHDFVKAEIDRWTPVIKKAGVTMGQ